MDVLFPQVCGICGKLSGNSLCKKCEILLERQSKFEIYENDSLENYFHEHLYFFKYDGIIRKIILNYKFNDKAYLYRTISNFLIKNKEFCEKVYKNLEEHNVYITNLAKCTQVDARPLKDEIFKSYLKIFKKEIKMVNPKKIILLGNQVSSIVLEEKIKVSEVRKKEFIKDGFKFYSVYYPVGNGIFNMDKAVEDILYIKRKEINTTLLIIKKENKILLARKKRGFGFGKWNGIGGKQQGGESMDEAMLRETKEEIGITPVDYQKIGIINFTEYYKEELTNVHMHTYIATDWKGNIEESEEMFPKWFDVDQLPWDDMFEDMKYFLPYLLDKKKIIGFFEYDKNWNLIKHEIQEQNK